MMPPNCDSGLVLKSGRYSSSRGERSSGISLKWIQMQLLLPDARHGISHWHIESRENICWQDAPAIREFREITIHFRIRLARFTRYRGFFRDGTSEISV